MSRRGLMRTALWTEIREALVKDFPNTRLELDGEVLCDVEPVK